MYIIAKYLFRQKAYSQKLLIFVYKLILSQVDFVIFEHTKEIEMKRKNEYKNTYHKGINIDKNFPHVLAIGQHIFHYSYKDLVNKHRFLHSVVQQNHYSIDIHIPPGKFI